MKSKWTKALLGVAAATLVVGAAASAQAACGDLNNNGSVTAADCNLIFDVAAGPPDPAGLCGGAGAVSCGDLNGDGKVNAADGVICNNFVVGNPPLTPLCAPQPTPVACSGGTKEYTSDIGSSVRWPNTCTIVINGTIKVTAGTVITIDAGTTIKGKVNSTSGDPSALVFLRDSKIVANGTPAAPIIMTSGRDLPGQPGGARTKGDWGGLVLNGRAPNNVPGGEGLSEGLTNVPFGGSLPNDSSGVLRYTRVEFAGRAVSLDNELNIITQNSIGAGTSEDHLEAHFGLDDCFEWFGGTVNAKFLLASACGDDGLDWQLGTVGGVQYAVVAQNINVVESGGNGFEGDNNENGQLLTPFSNPQFCNVTLIGTKGQAGTPAGANQVGALLRRGTEGTIANTIITGFHASAVRFDQNMSPACSSPTTMTGNLLLENSTIYNNGPGSPGTTEGTNGSAPNNPTPCGGQDFVNAMKASFGLVTTDPGVSLAYPPVNPVPTNAANVASTFDCNAINPTFDTTNYQGAFAPGAATLWFNPWAAFPLS